MRHSWSDLPENALISITQFTNSRFDTIHIRSVCSNWRKNVPPPPKSSPKLPVLLYVYNNVNKNHVMSVYKLFKITVFVLEEPRTNKKWLVTVGEPSFENKLCLLNPFSSRGLGRDFPDYAFPNKVVDLLDLRVKQVSTRYSLRLIGEVDEDKNREEQNFEIDMKLVDESKLMLKHQVCHKAEMITGNFNKSGSFLILDNASKIRGINVSDHEYWTKVGEELAHDYCDIVVYNEFFYCVDRYGTVIIVEDYYYEVSAVIKTPQRFLGEWYLVKAGGGLYLVGRDFRVCDNKVYYDEELHCFVAAKPCTSPIPVVFHVYVLNCNDPLVPEWDEVDNLGGYIFFVSRKGSFAIDIASDCSRLCDGNCIIYVDEIKYEHNDNDHDHKLDLDHDAIKELGGVKVGVYDFVGGTSLPISRCPNQFQMFWPPPEWLVMMSTGSCSTPSSTSDSTCSYKLLV